MLAAALSGLLLAALSGLLALLPGLLLPAATLLLTAMLAALLLLATTLATLIGIVHDHSCEVNPPTQDNGRPTRKGPIHSDRLTEKFHSADATAPISTANSTPNQHTQEPSTQDQQYGGAKR